MGSSYGGWVKLRTFQETFTNEEWDLLIDEVVERTTCNRYCPGCSSLCHCDGGHTKGSQFCKGLISSSIRHTLGFPIQCLGYTDKGPVMHGYNVYGDADDGIRPYNAESESDN
jgi:hypothetical protein